METRPVINLNPSKADKIIELTGKILLVAMWCIAIYVLIKSPLIIPLHYTIHGQADNYGSKWIILLFPVFGSIIYVGLGVLNKYPQIFNYIQKITIDNAVRQYSIAVRMLMILRLSILIIFCLVILLSYLNSTGAAKGFGAWFLPFTLIVILLPVIISIIQSLKKKL